MVTSQDMRHYVSKSAKQLDKDIPDWYKRIDTDILQMDSHPFCICGQLNIEGENPDPDTYASLPIGCSYTRGFFVEDYLPLEFNRREMNENTLKTWWIEEIDLRQGKV